ncbi:MAG: type II toxin-antitoxin system HipA family toxin, partial [Sciscionella sp.]
AYDPAYLASPLAYELDPALPLVSGQIQTPQGRALFGALTDCAPDGWGRALITRGERELALREHRAPRTITEAAFLLGVRDDQRQGALRFRHDDGPYLAEDNQGVPPFVMLPQLLNAAVEFERDTLTSNALRMLLRAGSSLGGARPKAHVIDQQGRVSIAKFPRVTQDDWDVTTWEAITLTLARDAGINVPEFTLRPVTGKPVLMIARFDRDATAQRIGYVSAMTMLEAVDREPHDYFDIAAVITQTSPNALSDLHELWRRIVFGRLIRNTDDHLRNHGFLRLTDSGWSLSPVFDVNPNPSAGEFATSLAGGDGDTPDVLLNPDVAAEFRLTPEQAEDIVREVATAIKPWRNVAARLGASSNEIALMANAIETFGASGVRVSVGVDV